VARPSRFAILFAFAVLYISWGTTYSASKVGLEYFPPCLFAGTRLALAGAILLSTLVALGQSIRLDRRRLTVVALSGFFLFMAGNGLLTYAQTMLASGMAAVLVSPTPLYFALLEWLTPRGERLTPRGWLGLALGLGGVAILGLQRVEPGSNQAFGLGFLLATGSSIAWSFGSLMIRHKAPRTSPFVVAGYQMLVGGLALTLLGLLFGEVGRIGPQAFTPVSIGAYLYLLAAASLGGFVAYIYLLAHVSPALVSTHAYVNPVVALIVGFAWLGEPITALTLGCMGVILAGVTLLRTGGVRKPAEDVPAIARHGAVHLSAPGVDPARQR
jgi:drug/metabolite transporter (DMT)-like permease